MNRISTPRKLQYVGYGKRRDKDGREQPPRYPSGLFFTNAAGCFYVDNLSELSDTVNAPDEPVQLALFDASHE